VTDGTTAGTSLVKDLAPGANSSKPVRTRGGRRLPLFLHIRSSDCVAHRWHSGGDHHALERFQGDPVALGGSVFYLGGTSQSHGLFTSNGTRPGRSWSRRSTRLVRQLHRHGLLGGQPVFLREPSVHGLGALEEQRHARRAVLVKGGFFSFNFPGVSQPSTEMCSFAIDDGVSGVELWRSDGTTQGTISSRTFLPGQRVRNP